MDKFIPATHPVLAQSVSAKKIIFDALNQKQKDGSWRHPYSSKELQEPVAIYPTELTQIAVLNNNTNTYIMSFKDIAALVSVDREKYLSKEDLFHAVGMRVGILRADAARPIQTADVQTFVNRIQFPAVAGFNPEHLEAAFQARLSFQRDRETVIADYPTNDNQRVPEMQPGLVHSTFNATFPAAIADAQVLKPARLGLDGYCTMPVETLMFGNARNEWKIELPTPPAPQWAGVAPAIHYIVLQLRGIIMEKVIAA